MTEARGDEGDGQQGGEGNRRCKGEVRGEKLRGDNEGTGRCKGK